MDLIQKYNDIKNKVGKPVSSNVIDVGCDINPQHHGALKWKSLAVKERDSLKEDCSKRILLDIYCTILPLDTHYVRGNMGTMKKDVDGFLDQKDMTGQQYLMSCSEKTNAPLLEFVLRSINNIGDMFMKESIDTLTTAQDKGIPIPPPMADVDNEDVESQIVEIQKDDEYRDFTDSLKRKTVGKLVKDISGIIKNKKDELNITFDSTNESVVGICVDYVHERLWNEAVEASEEDDEAIIGLSIRESTLNIIDHVFKQPNSDLKQFSSRLRFGKGVIINESAINEIITGSSV